MAEHFLVTGALGCLGSWVVGNLVRKGVTVTAFDLGTNPHRMKLIMSSEANWPKSISCKVTSPMVRASPR